MRTTPLYAPLELEGWCEEVGDDRARAVCEIRAGGEVCVRGEADMVVSRRILGEKERKAAPPVRVD